MEEKYIDLLLKGCLNIDYSKELFISYDVINKDFVDKLILKAEELGFSNIIKEETDINIFCNKLKTLSLEEIDSDPYFDKSIWDAYAKKGINFLMIDTEFPNFLDDVDKTKIAKAKQRMSKTRSLFRELESSDQIPWCIAAVPNKYWADKLFGSNEASYDKLFNLIFKMCLVDTENPLKSWEELLKRNKAMINKLNSLDIRQLHYTNSLGTDLRVSLPDKVRWYTASPENDIAKIVNMPSYEIFTSPNYLKTEGIVYNSKPLIYGGRVIDGFYLEFHEGKVINYDAKVGKELLGKILENDSNSSFLGEVALVNYDSPISNTKLVFETTLFDENASCHIALGDGFKYAIYNGLELSDKETLERGINKSNTHVDFMIGTSDLNIKAITKDGEIKLFKDGNFNI